VPERPGRIRARLRGTATATSWHPGLRETRLRNLRRCRVNPRAEAALVALAVIVVIVAWIALLAVNGWMVPS
jgi:hypothetical protein